MNLIELPRWGDARNSLTPGTSRIDAANRCDLVLVSDKLSRRSDRLLTGAASMPVLATGLLVNEDFTLCRTVK